MSKQHYCGGKLLKWVVPLTGKNIIYKCDKCKETRIGA